MGAARVLAREASTDPVPSKSDRISDADPLSDLVARHPGTLLWRVVDAGPPRSSPPPVGLWQVGAATAREMREREYAAYQRKRDAALKRRHQRRSGSR
jgi:hypothetical protein